MHRTHHRLYEMERLPSVAMCWVGGVAVLLFAPLDALSQPDRAALFFAGRCATLLLATGLGWALYTRRIADIGSLRAGMAGVFLFGAAAVALTVPGAGVAYPFYVLGFSLVIFSTGLFLAMTPARAGVFELGLLGVYAAMHAWAPFGRPPLDDVLYSLGFIGTAALLSGAAMASRHAERLEVVRAESALRQRNADLARSRVAVAGERAVHEVKDAFLARMSHELRTPLNAIVGYTELVREGCEEAGLDDEVADLDRVRQASENLLRLVSDILDLTALESGAVPFQPESLALDDVVGDVVAALRPTAEDKGLELVWSPPEVPVMVEHDRARLRQVLTALVGNAITFTEEGSVTVGLVRTADPERPVRLYVDDTGPGLPDTDVEQLFRGLTQGDESVTREVDGVGVGLALARGLARRMGGDVTAHPSEPRGASFVVDLPTQHLVGVGVH